MILPGLLVVALGDFPVNKTYLRVSDTTLFHAMPVIILQVTKGKIGINKNVFIERRKTQHTLLSLLKISLSFASNCLYFV